MKNIFIFCRDYQSQPSIGQPLVEFETLVLDQLELKEHYYPSTSDTGGPRYSRIPKPRIKKDPCLVPIYAKNLPKTMK